MSLLTLLFNKGEWAFTNLEEVENVRKHIIEITRKGGRQITPELVRSYPICPDPIGLVPKVFARAADPFKRSA